MNTFQEINELRKTGRLDEAYELAKKSLDMFPNDIWITRAYAWVVYSYLNRYASVIYVDDFVRWLEVFSDLPHDEDGSILYNSVCWSIRKLFHDACSHEINSKTLDSIFSLFRSIPLPPTGNAYSALLSAALRLERKWPSLFSFVEWWNLSNLSEKDFVEEKLDNGKPMMSLAERAYIFYAQWIVTYGPIEMSENFIPQLKQIVESYPSFVYPPYYLAKLYIKLKRLDEANELLKKFAKKKPNEFWVWQLLAETQITERLRLSFYCKALTCSRKEEMMVSLREHAASVFSKNGFFSEAKLEVAKALSIREQKGWHIPESLSQLQHSDWFVATEMAKDNSSFYLQHIQLADEFVFGATLSLVCLVTYVNKEKNMVSFVTEDRKQGFFKCPKNTKLPEINRLISIQTTEILSDKPTNVRVMTCVDDMNNDSFYKSFSGTLKIFSQGFGLVDKIYVDQYMLTDLEDKTLVSGLAVLSFDRKKQKWGWRALKIDKK